MSDDDTLADRYESSSGVPVVWNGYTIHPMLKVPVRDGANIRLRLLGSSRERAQALKLALNSGTLRVNGLSSSTMAIWSHTAPEETTIEVHGRRAATLDIWNAWSLDGVDNSWLGNYGIMVQDHAGGQTLQCSDGTGGPDFSDFVVWMRVDLPD